MHGIIFCRGIYCKPTQRPGLCTQKWRDPTSKSSLLVGLNASLPGISCFFILVCCNSTLCVCYLYLQHWGQACCPVYIIIYSHMATTKDWGDRWLYATLSTHTTELTLSCMSDHGIIKLWCVVGIFFPFIMRPYLHQNTPHNPSAVLLDMLA